MRRKQPTADAIKKTLLKRHPYRKALILILVLILLSFIIYRIWLNVHFLLTDDLRVSVSTMGESFSMHYYDKKNVTIEVSLENSFFCAASCSYAFTDISENRTVLEGSFRSDGVSKKFTVLAPVEIEKIGTGQKIYTFEATCNNIRTWYCLSNEQPRKRSSFITVNYDLSEYEKFQKEELRVRMQQMLMNLTALDSKAQKTNQRFFELGHAINLADLERQKHIFGNDFDLLVFDMEQAALLWREHQYGAMGLLLDQAQETMATLEASALLLDDGIARILQRHNIFIKQLQDQISKLDQLQSSSFLSRQAFQLILSPLADVVSSITMNSFSTYGALNTAIADMESKIQTLNGILMSSLENKSAYGLYWTGFEQEKFCTLTGCTTGGFMQNSIASYNQSLEFLNSVCANLVSLDQSIKEINTTSNITMHSIHAKLAVQLKNTSILDEKAHSLGSLLNMSENYLGHPDTTLINSSAMEQQTYEFFYENCQNRAISNFSFTLPDLISDYEPENTPSRIQIALVEKGPMCCILGECSPCCSGTACQDDPQLYPILLLHGHSFNSDNSPDFSLDAFNDIQVKLQEEGYVAAGTITPISNSAKISQGEWGKIPRPISVKGSYYRVSYYNLGSYSLATQKSENIETYAIRLKELIDLLQYRTGKDKVIIIAHSMGGLVTRSYLDIFGSQDVHKFIMIATPNNGINGTSSSYCSFFGENKECNDMSTGSIFLKKLNDPNTLQKINITNIIGTGCMTDGMDGDGVVIAESAFLPFAANYKVNGTCPSFSEVLHTSILDIDQYPEVYAIIRSELNDE